jgi:hypothetical protein
MRKVLGLRGFGGFYRVFIGEGGSPSCSPLWTRYTLSSAQQRHQQHIDEAYLADLYTYPRPPPPSSPSPPSLALSPRWTRNSAAAVKLDARTITRHG